MCGAGDSFEMDSGSYQSFLECGSQAGYWGVFEHVFDSLGPDLPTNEGEDIAHGDAPIISGGLRYCAIHSSKV